MKKFFQSMPDDELQDLWNVHRGLYFAFLRAEPTDALLSHCYRTLARHKIEPARAT